MTRLYNFVANDRILRPRLRLYVDVKQRRALTRARNVDESRVDTRCTIGPCDSRTTSIGVPFFCTEDRQALRLGQCRSCRLGRCYKRRINGLRVYGTYNLQLQVMEMRCQSLNSNISRRYAILKTRIQQILLIRYERNANFRKIIYSFSM